MPDLLVRSFAPFLLAFQPCSPPNSRRWILSPRRPFVFTIRPSMVMECGITSTCRDFASPQGTAACR